MTILLIKKQSFSLYVGALLYVSRDRPCTLTNFLQFYFIFTQVGPVLQCYGLGVGLCAAVDTDDAAGQ